MPDFVVAQSGIYHLLMPCAIRYWNQSRNHQNWEEFLLVFLPVCLGFCLKFVFLFFKIIKTCSLPSAICSKIKLSEHSLDIGGIQQYAALPDLGWIMDADQTVRRMVFCRHNCNFESFYCWINSIILKINLMLSIFQASAVVAYLNIRIPILLGQLVNQITDLLFIRSAECRPVDFSGLKPAAFQLIIAYLEQVYLSYWNNNKK